MEQSEAKRSSLESVPKGWDPSAFQEAAQEAIDDILPPDFVCSDEPSRERVVESRPSPKPRPALPRSEDETDPKPPILPPSLPARSPFDSSDPRFFLPEAPPDLPPSADPDSREGESDKSAGDSLEQDAAEQLRAEREAGAARRSALKAAVAVADSNALAEGATPAPPGLRRKSSAEFAPRAPAFQAGRGSSDSTRSPVSAAKANATPVPEAEADPSENLVVRYLERVCAFCYARLGTWPLAEEAAEETMVNALRAEHRWPTNCEEIVVLGWVLDVARAVCVDVQRRRAGQTMQEQAVGRAIERRGEERQADAPGNGSTDRLIRPDLAGNQGVVSFVVRLPEPGRSIVKMRAWDSRAFVEIAKALGRTEGSLVSLYAAALKKLDGIVNDPNSRVKPGDQRPDPGKTRPMPEIGDEKLLPAGCKALEEKLVAELSPPEGVPSREFLAQVARRVISNTSAVAGTVVGVTGPLDIFSADVSVGSQLRVAGCSPVARRPGDLIYAGELLLSSSTCAAMIRLRSDHLLAIAPASAAIAGRWDEASRASSANLLAGKMACVGSAEKARALLASAPGCKIESGQADWQAVALENGATRVDVCEGNVRVSTIKSEKHGMKRESIIASSRQAPIAVQVSPGERSPEWMARLSGSSSLTLKERDAIDAMMPGGVSKIMETSGAGAALEKLAELPAKMGMRALSGSGGMKLALIAGGATVAVAVFFLWRWWSGLVPSIDPWMRAAMAGYRKTIAAASPWPTEGNDHVLAWSSPSGALLELPMDQHRFSAAGGKNDKKAVQLSKEDFAREKGNALKLAARARSWPSSPRELVEEFTQALRGGDAWRIARYAPGFAADFWSDVFRRGAPVLSVETKPHAENPYAFEATIKFASGKTTKLRLLVQSDAAAAGRPYVDVLASRWN
jgi:DNA-directed RNA polymerase specialized sigma24 family protein